MIRMNMDEPLTLPALEILTAEEVIEQEYDSELLKELDEVMEDQLQFHSLAAYIKDQYDINRNAKDASGITKELITSLRQYAGKYSQSELAKIKATGGSDVYIKLTMTKARTLASWIKDILLNPKTRPWSLKATPVPDITPELRETIETRLEQEFDKFTQSKRENVTSNEQTKSEVDQEALSEFNKIRRELIKTIYHEIDKEADFNMQIISKHIEDAFVEGGFYEVLSDFIDDFTVFPTAFMKGPIITTKKSLVWNNGEPVVTSKVVFKNKRVSPFDIYPAPEATSIQDGALCEHLRLTASDLNKLLDLPEEAMFLKHEIEELIENGPSSYAAAEYGYDPSIESDKAELEQRGTSEDASRNIYHGIHFFGPVPKHVLEDWGYIELPEDNMVFEVEAIMVENKVIKCVLNNDPLLRRPYYCASFQNVPGSIWGNSLAYVMRDHQRICNTAARALVTNMGLSAGPQTEIYTDRLVDKSSIEMIRPLKIWQVSSSPGSGSGRAINFFQPNLHAQELVGVFGEFEIRADDATGIPKYQYGNEAVKGAGLTAAGLAMLFESSSKSVKNAIRNIDLGVIRPRVEYQFYMTILDKDIKFTGDVNVVTIGADTLSVKGSQEMRRNEFLQITANKFDQELMGREGRSALLKEIAKDMGLSEDIVPGYLEIKKRERKEQQQAAQLEQAKQKELEQQFNMRLAPAKAQIDGQAAMQQQRLAFEQWREELRLKMKARDQELKLKEIEAFNEQNAYRVQAQNLTNMRNNQTKEELALREMALKLKTGSGI